MLPHFIRLIAKDCRADALASPNKAASRLCLVRFAQVRETGRLAAVVVRDALDNQGQAATDSSSFALPLEPVEVDEFVQLADLLSQGAQIPLSTEAKKVVANLSAEAFWGTNKSAPTLPCGAAASSSSRDSPLMDALFLPGGRVATGWFHHGFGHSLCAFYTSTMNNLFVGGRRARLQSLAVGLSQRAAALFGEGNTMRHSVWAPACLLSVSTMKAVHITQRHSLLRSLRQQTKTSTTAEEAWMLLRLAPHVWWWRTSSERWEAYRRLVEAVSHSPHAPRHSELVSRIHAHVNGADARVVPPVSFGRLERGFSYLTGKPDIDRMEAVFSDVVVADVRRHLKTLREDERLLLYTDAVTSGGGEDGVRTDCDVTCRVPSRLAERHLDWALCRRASAVTRPSQPANSTHTQTEFAAFSTGVDAGSYWSSLLCVADFLCAQFHAPLADGSRSRDDDDCHRTLQDWRHALRAVHLRRYGTAKASIWASEALTVRAFPFLDAVQRSLDADAADTHVTTLWIVTRTCHTPRTRHPMPSQWTQFVESLPPRTVPRFGHVEPSLHVPPEGCGSEADSFLCCHLFGSCHVPAVQLRLTRDQHQKLNELLMPTDKLHSEPWACLVVKQCVCTNIFSPADASTCEVRTQV